MNIEKIRSDTPGCKNKIHLNNAGSALMPVPVISAITDHIELESRIGGYEAQHTNKKRKRPGGDSAIESTEYDE